MSGEDLLDYLARLYGRGAPLRDQLVERMELSRADLKRLVRDYSRGMRQKVGIIQALQHDPELAILDEPTEGLDPLMQRAFYDVLDERRKAGRTIFFSSHVLSEVERVCDRVAIIREGRLVALSRSRRCWRAAAATSSCVSRATRPTSPRCRVSATSEASAAAA